MEAFKHIKHIIFDLDGVLVDSEHLHAKAKRETLTHFGISHHVDYESFNGLTDQDFFQAMKVANPQLTTDMNTLLTFNRNKFISFYPEVHPIEGAKDFLTAAIEREIKLSNVTSATKMSQEQALKLLKVYDHFSIIC